MVCQKLGLCGAPPHYVGGQPIKLNVWYITVSNSVWTYPENFILIHPQLSELSCTQTNTQTEQSRYPPTLSISINVHYFVPSVHYFFQDFYDFWCCNLSVFLHDLAWMMCIMPAAALSYSPTMINHLMQADLQLFRGGVLAAATAADSWTKHVHCSLCISKCSWQVVQNDSWDSRLATTTKTHEHRLSRKLEKITLLEHWLVSAHYDVLI